MRLDPDVSVVEVVNVNRSKIGGTTAPWRGFHHGDRYEALALAAISRALEAGANLVTVMRFSFLSGTYSLTEDAATRSKVPRSIHKQKEEPTQLLFRTLSQGLLSSAGHGWEGSHPPLQWKSPFPALRCTQNRSVGSRACLLDSVAVPETTGTGPLGPSTREFLIFAGSTGEVNNKQRIRSRT